MARPDDAGRDDGAAGPSGPSAFALSRIHAEGWKVGRRVAVDLGAAAEAQADRLNPYTAAIERTRWRAGFEAALARSRR